MYCEQYLCFVLLDKLHCIILDLHNIILWSLNLSCLCMELWSQILHAWWLSVVVIWSCWYLHCIYNHGWFSFYAHQWPAECHDGLQLLETSSLADWSNHQWWIKSALMTDPPICVPPMGNHVTPKVDSWLSTFWCSLWGHLWNSCKVYPGNTVLLPTDHRISSWV